MRDVGQTFNGSNRSEKLKHLDDYLIKMIFKWHHLSTKTLITEIPNRDSEMFKKRSVTLE